MSTAGGIATVLRPAALVPATTPGRLWAALAGLLVVTAAAWTVAFVSVSGAQRTVQVARTDTLPAFNGARQAHGSLVDADRAVARSFLSGDVALGGPGERYQDDIKAASQAIQQLASSDAAAGDVQNLRTVDSLLVTYTGTVEQADATDRAGPSSGLGDAYLLYASKLLHERDPASPASSGVLARLDAVAAEQAADLDARQDTWWLGGAALLAGLVGCVGLVLALAGVQVWAARRFRRMLNPALLAATLVALAMLSWTAAGLIHLQDGFADARSEGLRPLVAAWQARTQGSDLDGQAALAAQLGARCGRSPCAATVDGIAQAARAGAGPHPAPATLAALQDAAAGRAGPARSGLLGAERQFNLQDAAAGQRVAALGGALDGRLRAAEALPGLELGISLLALLTGGLVVFGLRPRLSEYAP